MVRKMIQVLSLCLCITMVNTTNIPSEDVVYTTPPVEVVAVEPVSYKAAPTVIEKSKAMVLAAVPEITMSTEDIELIALVTMAEAEGESEEGKRLVIDTILNRVDSELSYFPDTVYDVIYQKNAFSSMWDGRVDKCYVDESICRLVREELVSRTNSEVMYFMAGQYSIYGTPMFSVGGHYFSGK